MRNWALNIVAFLIIANVSAQIDKEFVFYNDSSVYDVKYYNINLTTNTDSLYLKGFTKILAVVKQKPLDKFYIELNASLNVDSVLINNQKVQFIHDSTWVKCFLKTSLPIGSQFTVDVYYKGIPVTSSTIGGLVLDSYYDLKVLYSVSEPFSSLDFFACKQLLIDKADSVAVELNVPKGLMGISNGLLKYKKEMPGNQLSYRWESKYPIAYYLIAIAVSDFKEYTYKFYDTSMQDSLLFQNFYYNTPNYFETQKSNIDITTKIIGQYEKCTGISFPFSREKYGHVTAPIGGGMENQTITMVDNFNFDLVAHELAHSWFGDMVTCSDWQNIWINEGFASYFEYYANEVLQPNLAGSWMERCMKRALSDPNASIYIQDTEKWNERRIFSYFNTYSKGALIIHMLRYKIGNDSLFFRGLKFFLTKHAYSNANANDLQLALEQVTNIDFKKFFEQWYYGRGYPILDIDGKAQRGELNFTIKNSSSASDNNFTDLKLEVLVSFLNNNDSLLVIDVPDNSKTLNFQFNKLVRNVIFNPHYFLLVQQNINIAIDSSYSSIIDISGKAHSRYLNIDIRKNSTNSNNTDAVDFKLKISFLSKPDTILSFHIEKPKQNFSFHFIDIVKMTEVLSEKNFLIEFKNNIKVDTIELSRLLVVPNPFTNYLTLDFPDTGNVKSISLLDLNGKQVGKWQTHNTFIQLMDLQKLQAGPYFIYAKDGNENFVVKVVKAF